MPSDKTSLGSSGALPMLVTLGASDVPFTVCPLKRSIGSRNPYIPILKHALEHDALTEPRLPTRREHFFLKFKGTRKTSSLASHMDLARMQELIGTIRVICFLACIRPTLQEGSYQGEALHKPHIPGM